VLDFEFVRNTNNLEGRPGPGGVGTPLMCRAALKISRYVVPSGPVLASIIYFMFPYSHRDGIRFPLVQASIRRAHNQSIESEQCYILSPLIILLYHRLAANIPSSGHNVQAILIPIITTQRSIDICGHNAPIRSNLYLVSACEYSVRR
jgi:hypothetical protein